jgi:cellulose synthase/poly-beta-1,6-N-acetylglucosamine synthase-like glycosyltransferase
VLLPVRNGERHLPDAIASIEAQTEPDFEVIVVDDGSVDATPRILADWARRDARVQVVRQEPSGIVTALERARSSARGRYLARMDADDISEPGRLAEQRGLLDAEPAVALCGCRVRYFPEEAVRAGARRYEAWLNGSLDHDAITRELFVECPVAHPTFFMRAEAIEGVGGYLDRGWPEDYDLLLRLWAAGARLAKAPGTLLRWREGPERLSRTDRRYGPEAFRRCKAHHLAETVFARGRGAVLWGAGPVGKAFSRALRRVGVGVLAFVEVDARKIGQEIHGVPVLDTRAGLSMEGALHLCAVGQPGARETLRALLEGSGMEESRDFIAIA